VKILLYLRLFTAADINITVFFVIMACMLSIDVSDEPDNPILPIEGKPTAKIMLDIDKMVAKSYFPSRELLLISHSQNSPRCSSFFH
jgi:hypothetical protein